MIPHKVILKLNYKEAILLQKMIMSSRVNQDEEVMAYEILVKLVKQLETA